MMSFALGFVSALAYSLIGPALQSILLSSSDQLVQLSKLFGEGYATIFSKMGIPEYLAAETLWFWFPILLVFLATVRALLAAGQWFLWERLGELISKQIRSAIVHRFLDQSPIESGVDRSNELASAVTQDLRMTREYIVHFYGGLPRELLQMGFLMSSLVMMSWRLFIVFIIGVIPAAFLLSRIGKKIRNRSAGALDQFSQLGEWLQQRLLGIETIKQHGTEHLEIQKMEGLTETLFQRFLKVARVRARTSPVMEISAVGAMVIVLYLALSEVQGGQISGGVLLSFFSTLAVMAQSAGRLGRYLNTNKEGTAAMARVESHFAWLTEREWKKPDTPSVIDSKNHIEINGLSVRFPGQIGWALHSFSYNFEKGRVYSICGASGSGKTSLLKALLKQVHFNGEMRLGTELIGYVPQGIALAPDTVFANIAWPVDSLNLNKAELALKKVGLYEFVSDLPKGGETKIGTGGLSLSGGQEQRVLLARVLYHSVDLILIDEGTSALDPESEAMFYQCLKDVANQGVTIIVVAHRLSVLGISDEVLLLRSGQLCEAGPTKQVANSRAFSEFTGVEPSFS